jgi:hypothetical protein
MENVLALQPGAIAPGLFPDEPKVAAAAKCSHADCMCMINADEKYCGEYCEAQSRGDSAAGEHEHGCNCGHEDCASAA